MSIAIADGATETSCSKEWANALVDAYVQCWERFYDQALLAELIRDLSTAFHARIEERLSEGVPWYVAQKARQGAFAAFLGLTLSEDAADTGPGAVWRACAIGDCCVFQIRDRQLLVAFPLKRAADFGNRPWLVSSCSDKNTQLVDHWRCHQGLWQQGDLLLLMTDALACWFLRRWELQSDPLGLLLDMQSEDQFAEVIARERQEYLADGMPLLRNDDVTMLVCDIGG